MEKTMEETGFKVLYGWKVGFDKQSKNEKCEG